MPEQQSFVLYIVVGSGSKSGSRLPKTAPGAVFQQETPYISMRFSSTAGISSMSLSTEVSVSYTFVANNQHEQEETA